MIHALRQANPGQRAQVEQAIRDGRGDFAEIAHIVHFHGSIDYARRRAQLESSAATEAARALPASVFRDRLLDLVSFAMRRDR